MSPSGKHSIGEKAIAVILGGGRGARLWPLTKYRAKPAVPLAGKYRLIDIPISNCLNSGIDQIYILTQFNSSSLNRHISETYQLGPFSRGFVALEAASQETGNEDWYQGTADAVRRNLKQINQWQAEHVVILPGDTIFRMDLSEMLKAHIEAEADVTVALHPQGAERVSSFGIVTIDEHDRIEAMVEKPKTVAEVEPLRIAPAIRAKWNIPADHPFLASMGMYIFRRETLNRLLREREETDFGHHLLPRAVRDYRVFGYVFNDFWEDIGTIQAFFDVNLALAKPNPPFQFYYPGAPMYSRRRLLPSSRMQSVRSEQSTIAEGCRIEQAELECCMIGVRSIIGRGVVMHNTVMMGADYYEFGKVRGGYENDPPDAPLMGVGDACVIERTIIDKNARIGAGCRIVNEQGLKHYDDPRERYYIRDGIVIIPKHAIIEPGTLI